MPEKNVGKHIQFSLKCIILTTQICKGHIIVATTFSSSFHLKFPWIPHEWQHNNMASKGIASQLLQSGSKLTSGAVCAEFACFPHHAGSLLYANVFRLSAFPVCQYWSAPMQSLDPIILTPTENCS